MNKLRFLIVASLFLTSCASVNPYNVPEGTGSYLKNREEYKGKSYFVYLFQDAVTSVGKKSFEPDATTWAYDAIYKIPSGDIKVGLKILYYPKEGPVSSVGEAIGTSFKIFFSSDARSRFDAATTIYEIRVINLKEKVSGLEGIKLHAINGQAYQINCKVENGKAYVWIEDDSGKRISEVVRGFGVTKHNEVFVWEDLPPLTP